MGFAEQQLADPLLGAYPDPPLRDPALWRVATFVTRLKAEREEAIAAARARLAAA